MTDLERRALLGDKQAQEECTKKRIILPCPICGGTGIDYGICIGTLKGKNYIQCEDCGCEITVNERESLLAVWNTRPTPPIGRCRDCKNSPDIGTKTKGMRWCRRFRAEVKQDGYCEGFKPKECEYQEQQYLYHL